MYDFQSLIFNSATRWSEATSLVVLGVGLLYLLQGFRFARFLMALTCAGSGLVMGIIAVKLLELPFLVAIIAPAALGVAALFFFRKALMFSSMFTFGALAQYLAIQLGVRPNISMLAIVAGAAFGFSLVYVCRRMLPIVITILQGAGLLVVGFVGLSTALAPSLGYTFVDWSVRLPLMVPGLMTMLFVLGYSVQANAFQGDIESGGCPGLKDLEAS